MTRNQYNKNIHQELHALNERIDYKILHGQCYSEESRRHQLLRQRILKQSKRGLFSRLVPRVFQLQ